MVLASMITISNRIHLLLLGIMTPTIDETDIMEIVVDEEIEVMNTLNQSVIEAINFFNAVIIVVFELVQYYYYFYRIIFRHIY